MYLVLRNQLFHSAEFLHLINVVSVEEHDVLLLQFVQVIFLCWCKLYVRVEEKWDFATGVG